MKFIQMFSRSATVCWSGDMTMGDILRNRSLFHPTFVMRIKKRKRSKWKTLDGQLVDPVNQGTIKIVESLLVVFCVQNFQHIR